MSKRIANRSFFTVPAEELAPKLLGKILCHEVGEGKDIFVIKTRITVTEVYPSNDKFTDANRSNSPNAQSMVGGHIHYFYNTAEGRKRLDIVAGKEGVPESVLIAETDMYDGPQKTLWALDVNDAKYDGIDLTSPDSKIWLEDDGTIVTPNLPTCRKNLADDKPLRFSVKSLTFK